MNESHTASERVSTVTLEGLVRRPDPFGGRPSDVVSGAGQKVSPPPAEFREGLSSFFPVLAVEAATPMTRQLERIPPLAARSYSISGDGRPQRRMYSRAASFGTGDWPPSANIERRHP